jgi:hypothetical protein
MSIILRGFFIAAANVFYVTCGFGHFQFRHMIKALLLIFEPVKAWERVVRAQRSVVFILMVFLLPLLGLTSLAEGYGLVQWGRRQQDTLHLKQFTTAEAAAFETGQLLLSLATLFLATKIIKSLGETFHGRHSFSQVFTTMAYGLSPLFAMRLFDAFPGISHWVTWTAGILLSVTVLYQGVPRVMQPDPSHAFGLYLVSAILLALITGVARFLTAWYLRGEFKSVERIISDLVARMTS